MKILIDTDVVLDVALNREPFVAASGQVLDWAERHAGSASIAWHTLSNIAYLVKGDTRAFLEELLAFVIVPPTSTDAARQALTLPVADLEDALQVIAAMQFGATTIITRNTKDYRQSPIRAITPEQFLDDLEE